MAADRIDEFNGAAGKPVSKLQIEQLEKLRSTPTRNLDLTPSGARWTYVLSTTEAEKNRLINEKQLSMRKRLARRRGQTKRDFNNARDRRGRNDLGR